MADVDADPGASPDPKPTPRLGSYALVKPLGSGGMSNVFRAVHEGTGNVVAVKVLPRTLAKDATLLQRFLREAKSAEALDHPNIVAIFDRGFDQGRHYLVLEFVEGRDMHDRVRINGPLAPDEAVRFIREVAEGLRYAASRGMIHRDIKPANLLMAPDGRAKIIDLGLALQTLDEDERVTRDGTTVGTVDYMAPEQARDSRQTSERSDIYSLGCTFYYLLTGSAPYPGGGLADKLARHYKAPIPDVREHRPEVSERLSLLIRRMMEKKPDLRFDDYTRLIAALDALSAPLGDPGHEAPLDALIVDDDDDEIALAETEPSIGGTKPGAGSRPPSTLEPILMAEIVEDDDDEPRRPSSSAATRSGPRRGLPEPAPSADFSLAELAELDAQAAPRRGERRPPSAIAGQASGPRPPAVAPIAAILEDDDEPVYGSEGPARRAGGEELPLKTWIAAGVLVGLTIALVAVAVSMLVTPSRPETPEVAGPTGGDPPPPAGPTVGPTYPRRATGPVRPAPKKVDAAPKVDPSPVVARAETPEPPAEERGYSEGWESRLAALAPTAKATPEAKTAGVVVRRIAEPGAEPQATTLSQALTRGVEVVEIADVGPFFEDDLQGIGKTRLIRGRPGTRPMIGVAFTENDIIRAQPAKFVVGASRGDRLVLEGLDIVVDVRDLPEQQSTLFLCQGGELTLRDCSLTVLNAGDNRARPFSVVRVEDGARPNRVSFERTTVRGPVRSLVEVVAARADLALDRSIVVADAGPVVALAPAERASRSVSIHRSVLATRGSILEVAGPSTASPTAVRSLGSTFAKVEGGTPAGLVTSRTSIGGEPGRAVDWWGEDDAFDGWPSWLTSGTDAAPGVSGLGGVRAAWAGSETTGRETASPWPASILRDDLVAPDLVPLAVGRKATLAKIATVRPGLVGLTVKLLDRLPTPELSPSLSTGPMVTGPGPNPGVAAQSRPLVWPPPGMKTAPPSKNAGPPEPKPVPPLDLTFDALDPAWGGDLGRFLAANLVPGATRATVRVRGSGYHPISPIRLPDGFSISILGEAPDGSKPVLPIFGPRPEAAGRPLIDLKGGDLALSNLAFAVDGAARPRHWVRVEDGLLAIRHCRFRDPGAASPDVRSAIEFVARGSKPIPRRTGPFASETDRPTAMLKDCLIWTGGDAISAEVGRGVVELENCLIISGGPAVSLWPQPVERDRFEADLVLERCTIADDRTGILVGPWTGDPAGPVRPWLISSRSCVFPKTQSNASGALLQVDPGSMARGVVFWQSSKDAYDLARFVATAGPPSGPQSLVDVKRQWIDFWGPSHARSVQGPSPRRTEYLLRYLNRDRPRPGHVVPSALELDESQKSMGVDFKALPPAFKA